MHGQEALLSASLAKIIPLLWKEIKQNITEIGSKASWEALLLNDWGCHEVTADKQLCVKLGENKLDVLTLEKWWYASLFIWKGCCMHKEMNSVKGDNAQMMAWWSKNNLEALQL